jgi:hypothetical protein
MGGWVDGPVQVKGWCFNCRRMPVATPNFRTDRLRGFAVDEPGEILAGSAIKLWLLVV